MNYKTAIEAIKLRLADTPEKILSQIKDTVDVVEVIKPIYNFKAAEKSRKKGK